MQEQLPATPQTASKKTVLATTSALFFPVLGVALCWFTAAAVFIDLLHVSEWPAERWILMALFFVVAGGMLHLAREIREAKSHHKLLAAVMLAAVAVVIPDLFFHVAAEDLWLVLPQALMVAAWAFGPTYGWLRGAFVAGNAPMQGALFGGLAGIAQGMLHFLVSGQSSVGFWLGFPIELAVLGWAGGTAIARASRPLPVLVALIIAATLVRLTSLPIFSMSSPLDVGLAAGSVAQVGALITGAVVWRNFLCKNDEARLSAPRATPRWSPAGTWAALLVLSAILPWPTLMGFAWSSVIFGIVLLGGIRLQRRGTPSLCSR